MKVAEDNCASDVHDGAGPSRISKRNARSRLKISLCISASTAGVFLFLRGGEQYVLIPQDKFQVGIRQVKCRIRLNCTEVALHCR